MAADDEEEGAERNEARKITIMLNYVLGAARLHGLLCLRRPLGAERPRECARDCLAAVKIIINRLVP